MDGIKTFTENQKLVADVNNDRVVDDVDVHILAKYISDGGTKPDGYNIKLPYISGQKYTIKYNLNGGITSSRNPQTYAQVSLPIELDNPEKEGYAFIGWTGSNGSTPQLEVTIPEGTTGNLEYNANWLLYGDINNDGEVDLHDLITISQYLDGIKTFTENQKLVADVNNDIVVDDVDVHILAKYISDGGTKPDGYNIKLPYISGQKYTIKYNLNGGITSSRNPQTYAQVSLPIELDNPEKEGYVFIGWTGSNGSTPQLEVTIEEGTTGNLEYNANWLLYGDVNNDNKVDIGDSILIQQYIEGTSELTKSQKLVADVNLDSKVDDIDVKIIRDYLAKKINKLPYTS